MNAIISMICKHKQPTVYLVGDGHAHYMLRNNLPEKAEVMKWFSAKNGTIKYMDCSIVLTTIKPKQIWSPLTVLNIT